LWRTTEILMTFVVYNGNPKQNLWRTTDILIKFVA